MNYTRDAEGRFLITGPASIDELFQLAAETYRGKLVGASLGNPRDSGDYLRARLRPLPYEVFVVLLLDNRHRVLGIEELFRGTVDGASVHPREVVREVIKYNACAVIFAHNHPSGVAEPSAADRAITHELRDALQLVGTRVLDHLVIGDGEPVSMAARGLL